MKPDPDIQLMLQFQSGDADAFRVLFMRHKSKIINFCYRFCGSREEAEELAQEVFVRVYRAAPRYKPTAQFTTWLFKIATNVCLNAGRQKWRQHKTDSLDAPPPGMDPNPHREIEDPEPGADERVVARERAEQIRRALAGLPEKQRAALLLKIDQGFTYAQIGRQLKCPENTVKTLIRRARQTLLEHITPYMQENGHET